MTTIVFPGQGSQYLGMAEDFYDTYEEAREVFNIVESATNIPLKEIIIGLNQCGLELKSLQEWIELLLNFFQLVLMSQSS